MMWRMHTAHAAYFGILLVIGILLVGIGMVAAGRATQGLAGEMVQALGPTYAEKFMTPTQRRWAKAASLSWYLVSVVVIAALAAWLETPRRDVIFTRQTLMGVSPFNGSPMPYEEIRYKAREHWWFRPNVAFPVRRRGVTFEVVGEDGVGRPIAKGYADGGVRDSAR